MKQKRVVLIFALVMASGPVFSASLEDLVGSERVAALSGGNRITEIQLKNPALLLLPRHGELRRLAAESMNTLEPGIVVETLYRYQKPQSAGASGWSEAERTKLFNQVLALSTMTGIQYYSASRGAMRTLYAVSQVIDKPESKRPIPDPVYAAPPPALTLYVRLKDLTFGDNIYRYDCRSAADAFFFVQENLTTLSAGIIPAIGKNKLRTLTAVIDSGDSLLIYAVSMVKAASLPGMGERIGESFSNRAQAIFQWFSGRADGVFGNS